MFILLWEAGYEMKVEYPDGRVGSQYIGISSSKLEVDLWIKEAIKHGAPADMVATLKESKPTSLQVNPKNTPKCYEWEYEWEF